MYERALRLRKRRGKVATAAEVRGTNAAAAARKRLIIVHRSRRRHVSLCKQRKNADAAAAKCDGRSESGTIVYNVKVK